MFISGPDQYEDDATEDENLAGIYLITSTREYRKQLSEGQVPVTKQEPSKPTEPPARAEDLSARRQKERTRRDSK
jgi:hypothetical protein